MIKTIAWKCTQAYFALFFIPVAMYYYTFYFVFKSIVNWVKLHNGFNVESDVVGCYMGYMVQSIKPFIPILAMEVYEFLTTQYNTYYYPSLTSVELKIQNSVSPAEDEEEVVLADSSTANDNNVTTEIESKSNYKNGTAIDTHTPLAAAAPTPITSHHRKLESLSNIGCVLDDASAYSTLAELHKAVTTTTTTTDTTAATASFPLPPIEMDTVSNDGVNISKEEVEKGVTRATTSGTSSALPSADITTTTNSSPTTTTSSTSPTSGRSKKRKNSKGKRGKKNGKRNHKSY